MNKPFSIYIVKTGEVIDQSASHERAKDRMWEIANEDANYFNVQLAITNEAEWNQETI